MEIPHQFQQKALHYMTVFNLLIGGSDADLQSVAAIVEKKSKVHLRIWMFTW